MEVVNGGRLPELRGKPIQHSTMAIPGGGNKT